ncbi:arylamine N-acetyltransferase family protein [Haloferax sp. YSSS75]|uniref:arylamine N-acetyltransferase family protein n=1 Tax=Haloferax sp. YSSS75 TaxID=3388564 RepID=UPI00398CB952
MNTDAFCRRIGIDPDTLDGPRHSTLERLQHAHVTTVPFENLAVTGDPFDESDDGEGVVLDEAHLFEKIVERGCGGFCFELNGLFNLVLSELGFDVDRVAARVIGSDGTGRPPANHLTNVVELDRQYVVDVGTGPPTMRRPLPLDGSVRTDDVGVSWRVAPCDRPDETYVTQYRTESDDEWRDRYWFSETPRPFHYFEATCEYLQTAPESTFTGDPVVSIGTETGHLKLGRDTLTRTVGGDETTEHVEEAQWHEVLAREFGLQY